MDKQIRKDLVKIITGVIIRVYTARIVAEVGIRVINKSVTKYLKEQEEA